MCNYFLYLLIPNTYCQTKYNALYNDIHCIELNNVSINDSLARKNFLKTDLFQSLCISTPLMTESFLYKPYDVNIRDMRRKYLSTFEFSADTYLQFVPFGLCIGLKSFGVPSRSNWQEFLTASILSYTIGYGTSRILKTNISKLRPDWGGFHSFPSGHTTLAFIGATILSKEYKDNYPYISALGYGLSTATGLSRIMNDRHWTSDVLFGAGLGIIATELSYYITDILYKNTDKQYTSYYITQEDTNLNHWSINFFFSYNCLIPKFKSKTLSNNTTYKINNGIGLGIESSYMITPHLGINLKAKVDSYKIDNINIWWPEDSILFVPSIELGPIFTINLCERLHLSTKIAIGLNHIKANSLQDDIPLKSQNNLIFSQGISANYYLRKHLFAKAFCDLNEFGIKIENNKQNLLSFCCGLAFGCSF